MTTTKSNILTFILAGGKGTRLHPLTRDRTKPAVPFAGRYRIIDFVLSSCLNSGLRRIYLLTQTKSHSLDRHIQLGWNFLSPDLDEFVANIPAQQRVGEHWYRGTADAIYQNLYLMDDHEPEHVMILSGDHIYKMDFNELLDQHIKMQSDLTVAVKTIKRKDASEFGVLAMTDDLSITTFLEKPKDPAMIPGTGEDCHINMGIYLFKASVLRKVLEEDAAQDTAHDFGKNIIPSLLANFKVNGFVFEKSRFGHYWQDVGTIRNFYDANMDFLNDLRDHEASSLDWRLRTLGGQMPASYFGRMDGVHLEHSAVGSGSHLQHCKVINSIIGRDVWVGKGCLIKDAVINNGSRIGDDCVIQNAILDHKVMVSAGEKIGVDLAADEKRGFTVSDGIVVLPKKYKV